MTNVDKLAVVGIVHPGRLSDEQRTVINDEMSDAEIDALVSAHRKLGGEGTMHSTEGGHASLF